ncbi:MAG: glycerol-3-phosphate 1-O-acyltransferase PlsY [Ruminococcaceae bacterium]|nr:glycerol-3-phosphate 1-O-acyltransferase PlsY [Oscillospiraceae bacterium]
MKTLYEIFNVGIVRYLFGTRAELDGIVQYNISGIYIIPALVLILLIAYLLGSINFAMFISKRKYKDDIREHGSGNAGMTNMMRTYGKKAAGLTLAGDALKTLIAVLIGYLVMGGDGAYVAGLGAIIGHTWPLYYNFKGGKGVVTTITMILCTSPLVGLILLCIFVAIVAMTKFISLGSIMGALLYPLILSAFSKYFTLPQLIVCFSVVFLVVFNHRSNIKRLMEGTENKFSFKKSK